MFRATTIVAVKKDGEVTIAGDGQVTYGQTFVLKAQAKKYEHYTTVRCWQGLPDP